jgi:ABC-type Fe3+-hydroxamate transport system substrate-binding protein
MNNNETPEERFRRLATSRTNAVLDKLRILGNLSNKQLYNYSEEDAEKIFNAINKEIKAIRNKFMHQKQQRFNF